MIRKFWMPEEPCFGYGNHRLLGKASSSLLSTKVWTSRWGMHWWPPFYQLQAVVCCCTQRGTHFKIQTSPCFSTFPLDFDVPSPVGHLSELMDVFRHWIFLKYQVNVRRSRLNALLLCNRWPPYIGYNACQLISAAFFIPSPYIHPP